MTASHYVGIDPGPTPGIVMLTPRGFRTRLDIDVLQCTERVAPTVLWMLLDQCRSYQGSAPAVVALERFVVGRRSARSSSAKAGATTRDLVGKLEREAGDQPNVTVVLRNASQVKAWATDVRLEAAGLLDACRGMRHARDAARHALFAAVHDGGIPDPLSKEWNR